MACSNRPSVSTRICRFPPGKNARQSPLRPPAAYRAGWVRDRQKRFRATRARPPLWSCDRCAGFGHQKVKALVDAAAARAEAGPRPLFGERKDRGQATAGPEAPATGRSLRETVCVAGHVGLELANVSLENAF